MGDRRVDLRVEHALFGVALGQSIALGTCAGFGTLFPAVFGGTDLFHGDGLVLLIGVCITLAGIAVIGYAGSLRAHNMTEEEKKAAVKDFALTKGLLVALLAGVMSACFNLGLESGAPILEKAKQSGRKRIVRTESGHPVGDDRGFYHERLLLPFPECKERDGERLFLRIRRYFAE